MEPLRYGKEARHKRPHVGCIHLKEMSRIGKSIDTESRFVTARGLGVWLSRNGELLLGRNKASVCDDEIFWN